MPQDGIDLYGICTSQRVLDCTVLYPRAQVIRPPKKLGSIRRCQLFSGFHFGQPTTVIQGRSTRSPSLEGAVARLKLYNESQLIPNFE